MRDQIHCYSSPNAPGYVLVNAGNDPRCPDDWEREWSLNVHDMELSIDALGKKARGASWGEGYLRFRMAPMELRGIAVDLTTLRKKIPVYKPDDPRERGLAVVLVCALIFLMTVVSLLKVKTVTALAVIALCLAGIVAVYSFVQGRRTENIF